MAIQVFGGGVHHQIRAMLERARVDGVATVESTARSAPPRAQSPGEETTTSQGGLAGVSTHTMRVLPRRTTRRSSSGWEASTRSSSTAT